MVSKKLKAVTDSAKPAGLMEFGFEGAPVRMVMQGDVPWFNADDVCVALGYQNTPQTLDDHVDMEDRNTISVRYGIRGNPNKNFVNESGMYALIFGSSKPRARRFKRWVTSEVLPQIRRSGQYQVNGAPAVAPAALQSDDLFALTPTLFTRLYYAMDKRLGAVVLIWYLIEHGALDKPFTSSTRAIAADIGEAVKHTTIHKFAYVLRDEGYLEFSTGGGGVPGRYRLLRSALEQTLIAVPDYGDERPGLDMILLDMAQNDNQKYLH